MKQEELYDYYLEKLKPIPEFLNKYLDLDILVRLKDISILCGMDYASKNMYDIAFTISRYDHSLNTALITWKLTQNKQATLAALFHDVASPAFSHVIDFMNGDFQVQESTEEKTSEILKTSNELLKLLSEDKINIDDIVDFKKYKVVDSKRPHMCADRLENLFSVGINWVQKFDKDMIDKVINSIFLTTNEFGFEEIAFNDIDALEYLIMINDKIDSYTHSKEDFYMMNLMANIIKYLLKVNLVTYEDLFKMGEHEVISIIENNICYHYYLSKLWYQFNNCKKEDILDMEDKKINEVKKRTLNPIIVNRRLFQYQ